MFRIRPLFVCSALFLSSRAAHADPSDWTDRWEDQYDPGRAARRSGFAAGASFGGTVGGASGYPNDVEKIDDPAFLADTGVTTGGSGSFWIGGALRDWLVVGVGFHFSSLSGRGYESAGGQFVFHLEGFPLFYRGPIFRDLGVLADFGAGSRTITTNSNTVTVANGGSMAFIALGLIYEPWRLGGHVSAGPILEVAEEFSQTLKATTATLGIQFAFYGGPD